MMNGLVDLTKSERGIFALAVLVSATVLLALGRIDAELWAGVTVLGQGIYTMAKTRAPGSRAGGTPDLAEREPTDGNSVVKE